MQVTDGCAVRKRDYRTDKRILVAVMSLLLGMERLVRM